MSIVDSQPDASTMFTARADLTKNTREACDNLYAAAAAARAVDEARATAGGITFSCSKPLETHQPLPAQAKEMTRESGPGRA